MGGKRRKKELVALKVHIQNKLRDLDAEKKPSIDPAEFAAGFSEPGDRHYGQLDVSVTMRGKKGRLLRKYVEALRSIENGTYGICTDCEEEIPIERLKVRPQSQMCITCRKQQEELVRRSAAAFKTP